MKNQLKLYDMLNQSFTPLLSTFFIGSSLKKLYWNWFGWDSSSSVERNMSNASKFTDYELLFVLLELTAHKQYIL